MIKIIKETNKITISGHANYSDSEDIVCASVSSIMYTSVNLMIRFDNESIKYEDVGNKVIIEIIKTSKENDLIIENMMSLFKDLEDKFPKNIKINTEG